MPQRFVSADRDQQFLLPPDMREWLPEDHLAWLVIDSVAQFDLAPFRRSYRDDGSGRPAFDPALMVALLLYGFCQGDRASRQIERRCVTDVAYRVIAGGHRPDHATIARFRVRHEARLGALFTDVLRLLAAEGMVSLGQISIDGTKVAADARWQANRTLPQIEKMLAEAAAADAADDEKLGEAQGDEPPATLAGRSERLKRLTAARDRLVAEDAARHDAQKAKIAAWEARRAAGSWHGRKPGDKPPRATVSGSEPRANLTDPDARMMRSKHSLITGYNAQIAVTSTQVIVAATVVQQSSDGGLLPSVIGVCRDQLTAAGIRPRLRTVLADTGYASEETFAFCDDQKLRLLAPLPRTRSKTKPHTAAAARRLRHHRGKADYKMRAQTVEPTFGQLKTCQNMTRFTRRGLPACSSEWLLACAAHNLTKLHRHRQP
jgi:transposase